MLPIARWNTRQNKYWFELYQDELGFSYKGNECGGNLGNISLKEAIQKMEKKIDYMRADGFKMQRSI
jgi:hypothetical protein